MNEEEIRNRRRMAEVLKQFPPTTPRTHLTERDLAAIAWLRHEGQAITDELNRRFEAKRKATNALLRLKEALRPDDPSST